MKDCKSSNKFKLLTCPERALHQQRHTKKSAVYAKQIIIQYRRDVIYLTIMINIPSRYPHCVFLFLCVAHIPWLRNKIKSLSSFPMILEVSLTFSGNSKHGEFMPRCVLPTSLVWIGVPWVKMPIDESRPVLLWNTK